MKIVTTAGWGVACLLLCTAAAQADIYKFVDENNIVHFTNIPNDPRYRVYKRTAPQRVAVPYGSTASTGDATARFHEANRRRYSSIVDTAAEQYQVDPALVHAVIMAESGYNPNALSPKGATGIMQLMPGTARRYGVANSYDAASNIRGGTRYLRDLLQMFNNNVHLAVAAYNAGENAVIRHGHQIPPYKETRNYVDKVITFYQSARTKRPA